ncbi:11858_t:CDS:2 [Acaulospora morrowiae]|uniref:11858_t:CDS:1 n=1 Tax=Acaulospora morrowiae TaxID=94023 RepID=A0A9N9AYM6_9GLOM|nr:11858_t:CDS:2 [Acaulospora morrowiae]
MILIGRFSKFEQIRLLSSTGFYFTYNGKGLLGTEFEKPQPVRFAYDDSDSEFEDLESDKKIAALDPPIIRISNFKKTLKLSVNLVLIGIHGGGNLFLESITNKKKLIGTILLPEVELVPTFETQNTLNQETHPNQGCFIYELESNPRTLIIPCNYKTKDERCFTWVKSLFEHIDPERVFIFDTFKSSLYIAGENYRENRSYPPFCRLLQSSVAPKLDHSIPKYEPPNLVCNLSAALLSHCEIHKIPAYLLLSLQDTFFGKTESTSETLQGFQEALENLQSSELGLDFNFDAMFNQNLKRIQKNLYI